MTVSELQLGYTETRQPTRLLPLTIDASDGEISLVTAAAIVF
jgi:hypothetical protein